MLPWKQKKDTFSIIIAYTHILHIFYILHIYTCTYMFIHTYRYIFWMKKRWVYFISTWRKKCRNLKNVHFEKPVTKVKKHDILIFMTTFCNFSFKKETGWAKMVDKPILETTTVAHAMLKKKKILNAHNLQWKSKTRQIKCNTTIRIIIKITDNFALVLRSRNQSVTFSIFE